MSTAKQRGFTLIEIVVAFALFALSIGALYETFGSGLHRSAQSALRVRALLTAQSLLDAQRVAPSPWSPMTTGSTADGLSWQIATQPHADVPASQNGCRSVDVKVQVREPTHPSSAVTLRSLELVRDPT